jgi:hypothetical protein
MHAMNPNDLRTRIEQAILARIDPLAWHRMREIMANWQQSIPGQAMKQDSNRPLACYTAPATQAGDQH